MTVKIDMLVNPSEYFRILEDRIVMAPVKKKYISSLLNGMDRSYHSTTHVGFLMSIQCQLLAIYGDKLGFTEEDISIFEHVMFIHDAIYFPSLKTNEMMSANLWEAFAPDNGSKPFVSSVKNITLSTANHFAPTIYHNKTQWFLGLDLAHFAKPYDLLYGDEINVLREYEPYVPWDVLISKRVGFLEYLLSRDKIYRHPILFAEFEVKARKNIRRLLASKYAIVRYSHEVFVDDEIDLQSKPKNDLYVPPMWRIR